MKRIIVFAAAACVAAAPACAQSRKPVVAVAQIDDLARSGKSDVLAKMIETAVAASGKFRLMERDSIGTLMGEQVRAKGGIVTSNKPKRVGGFEGADYLIYGAITSVGTKNSDNIGSTFVAGLLGNKGAHCENKIATLAMDVKITDTDTGEIKYVKQLNESQRSQASCDGSAEIDVPQLLRQAANHVASGLVTAIYPILVASVQSDGTLVLNYGEGAVDPGQVFAVYSKGDAIRDPSTGEVIANNETRLGYVRVSEIAGRISKATPLVTFASLPAVGSVVRPASDDEVRALTKPQKRK